MASRDACSSGSRSAKKVWSGTAWEITPVTEIDGIPVGDGKVGPVTKKLQQVYFDLVMGIAPGPHGWLTTL